jgi:hypothetical protein
MNGNYDDDNPGKDDEKPGKDSGKKGFFSDIKERLKSLRGNKNSFRESMSTLGEPPSPLRNSFERERNTIGTPTYSSDEEGHGKSGDVTPYEAMSSQPRNKIGTPTYTSDEEGHAKSGDVTPYELMPTDPQRTLVGNADYSTDEDHPGKGDVTPYQPMPAYTGAHAWQMPNSSALNGSQTPDGLETPDRPSNSNGAAPKLYQGSTQSAKTRDRNSSVSGIDLDGSTKRTLDAVSSKLDGISGKPAESSKRFSVVDLKKTFESKPQANDELAETSGYHSDSTQNVDVKTLRSRFEKPSNASIIVEQSKLSSDAKPKETEKALSRSNSFSKK